MQRCLSDTLEGINESVLRTVLQNHLWYLCGGRDNVEILWLGVRVGIKRTRILEMFNLIIAKKHQAIEKVDFSIVLKKC